MKLEFEGISSERMQEILAANSINLPVESVSQYDKFCAAKPKEAATTPSTTGAMTDEASDCACQYMYCYGLGSHHDDHHGCGNTGDCDMGNSDDGIAILVVLVVFIILFAILLLIPGVVPAIVVGFELLFALGLGLFNVITFGIFRNRFKRAMITFPTDIPESNIVHIIQLAAVEKAVPRNPPDKEWGTWGFGILRIGAYIFVMDLIAFPLMFLAGVRAIMYTIPAGFFVFALLVLWLGDFLIVRKAHMLLTLQQMPQE